MTTLVSGSPIIQNGRLIGAATHVLINDPTNRSTRGHHQITHVLIDDPTRGYGIFAENMLENMRKPTEK